MGTGIEPVFTDLQSCGKSFEISELSRKKYQDISGTAGEHDTKSFRDPENENPGALAGATGANVETSGLHCKDYDDASIGASGSPLRGDWNRERWAWLAGVNATLGLSPIAKCLAGVIVTQAADHLSGDCLWRNERFADALAVSVDTIKRAFRALADAGWLIRTDGRGRGNCAVLTLTAPCDLAAVQRIAKQGNPARRASTDKGAAAVATSKKGCIPASAQSEKQGRTAPFSRDNRKRKRVQNCVEKGAELHFPPTPPYKDTPNILQKGRVSGATEKPRLNNPFVAHHGSDRESEWNTYLASRRWPSLAELGVKSSDSQGTGWEVPYRTPPGTHNSFENSLVARWVEWAMQQRELRGAA